MDEQDMTPEEELEYYLYLLAIIIGADQKALCRKHGMVCVTGTALLAGR